MLQVCRVPSYLAVLLDHVPEEGVLSSKLAVHVLSCDLVKESVTTLFLQGRRATLGIICFSQDRRALHAGSSL